MNHRKVGPMKKYEQNIITRDYFGNIEKIPEMLGIEKKDLGAYYTDESIVNYILDNLDIEFDSYVLDPSCGCGSFIFPLYLRVLKDKGKQLGRLYGVDIDKKAVDYTVNFLSKISQDTSINKIADHIISGDFIFRQKSLDGRDDPWQDKASEILKDGGFDFIIGNPPFNLDNGSKRRPVLTGAEHQVIARKSNNIPIYFIMRGTELLAEGGVLAFVLPKTLLYVGRYHDFRTYILKNYTILRITEIGIKFKGVRGEQIILFIKNKKPIASSTIEFSSLAKKPSDRVERAFNVPQNYFKSMGGIPTMPNNQAYEIIQELKEKHGQVSDFSSMDICRGVSLGKNNVKTIPYERGNGIRTDGFIRGKDISKLHLKSLAIPDAPLYKTSELTRIKRPKIVLQNIYSSESGLISYLDKQGLATTETVTNIIIPDKRKLAYLHALINSKLLNFYLSQAVFSGSRLTMHMDSYYLKQLPLLWDQNRYETGKIVELGDKSALTDPADVKSILEEIDKWVYKLYGIKGDQRRTIEGIMAKTLSHKSLW